MPISTVSGTQTPSQVTQATQSAQAQPTQAQAQQATTIAGDAYNALCKEALGEKASFVDHFHARSTGGKEETAKAQKNALEAFKASVPSDLYTGVDTRMCHKLGVTADDSSASPVTKASIKAEVESFVGKALIEKRDQAAINAEIDKFIDLYTEAYPQSGDKALVLARDNARRLAFQVARDREMFTGSDHGTKHILEGNMALADQMISDLRKAGVPVSAKDALLIHQTLIDHDLGYTSEEAGTSFLASKDHPLASTAYIDAKQNYYEGYFPGESKTLSDAVLMHSYPQNDFESDNPDGVHPETIKSVTSMVDALGVAASNKSPRFFTEPDVVMTLGKLHLAKECGKADEAYVKTTQDAMRTLLEHKTEIPADMKARFETAIDNNMTKLTGMFLLPQYGVTIKGVSVERGSDGALHTNVNMGITSEQQELTEVFGPGLAFKNAGKALKDFGADKASMGRLQTLYAKPYTHTDATTETVRTPLATFNIEIENKPETSMAGVFSDLKTHSLRGDLALIKERIANMPDNLSPEETKAQLAGARGLFLLNVMHKMPDLDDMDQAVVESFAGAIGDATSKANALALFDNAPVLEREVAFINDHNAIAELKAGASGTPETIAMLTNRA